MRTRHLLVFLALGCALTSNAQQISNPANLDAGYLQFNKKFTQNVIIKGAELEQMPFTRLSDALSASLFGAYTRPAALQYIVDGNPVTDINAYSIHDIDEIIWIANAAALGATAGTQQQLILIKTRRPESAAGIKAAAQTGAVNSTTNGAAHDNHLYQDYYATAWRNWTKIKTGVSADWTRNYFPITMPHYVESTPFNVQRWRLNGYLNFQLNKTNDIDANIHFTSNEMDYQFDSLQHEFPKPVINGGAVQQQLVNLGFRWQGNWLPRLHNELLGTYLLYRATALNSSNGFVAPYAGAEYEIEDQALRTSHHFWVRDRLNYRLNAGNWRFEPSLYLSYEHIDMESGNMEDTIGATPYSGLPGGTVIGIAGEGAWQDASPSNIMFISPSIDMTYRDWFDLTTGLQYSPSKWEYATSHKYFPFATFSLDLFHMLNPTANQRLQISGSYAQRAVQSIRNYTLLDVNRNLDVEPKFPFYYGAIYTGKPANYPPIIDATFTYPFELTPGYPSPTFWAWSAGLSYTGLNDRLQAQYYFERRNFTTSGVVETSPTDSAMVLSEWRSAFHHVDIRATVIETKNIRWTSSINVNLVRSSLTPPGGLHSDPGKPVIGDVSPNSWSYTGGWVNRLQINKFTAGLDLLYHFGAQTLTPQTGRINALMLPNVYAGYSWRVRNIGTFEWFLETRGALRTTPSDLLDSRRFYTIGGKFSL